MKTNRFQIVLLAVLLGLGSVLWAKHTAIQDWVKLRGYTPPNAVVQLADEDTMNDYTRHLFYLNKPQLLPTVTDFRKPCPENQDTVVLGCYHPGQNGIYIYNVQDPTLAGIQQVTAAHEVLHAVYARLSNAERNQLNKDLEDYYEHGLTDANVKAEVAIYKRTEPDSVYDEMSCTFGTEIAQLPAALETYYSKYFTNRQKIVGYEQQYQAQFTSRRQQISTDDAQLATMKNQINKQQSSLTAQNADLSAQKAHLQQLLGSGQVAAYNAAVSGYNAQVHSYNAGVAALQQSISAYNQLVDARNAIAGQLTTLSSDIDTRVPAAVTP